MYHLNRFQDPLKLSMAQIEVITFLSVILHSALPSLFAFLQAHSVE